MENKAAIFYDVFNSAEIDLLKAALSKLPDKKNFGDNFFGFTNGFKTHDFIFPFINKVVISKLEKLMGEEIKLTYGFFIKEEQPLAIHTDYPKNDKNPKYAFLLPLHTVPAHTIIFNEECLTSFSDLIEADLKVENNAKDLYADLCSHVTESHLEYVSLFATFKWEVGSVICWDRKLLHCSDNFTINGLNEKIALVLFTNND